ncbi:hypothetical protein D3C71_1892270 [compost metagenome]
MPKTLSPALKRETLDPTASTMPANSDPSTVLRGLLIPRKSRAGSQNAAGTRNARSRASPEVTVVATIRTSTSFSLGTGLGISRMTTTSGPP